MPEPKSQLLTKGSFLNVGFWYKARRSVTAECELLKSQPVHHFSHTPGGDEA